MKAIYLAILLILVDAGSALSWYDIISTDSTTWSIHRESVGIDFEQSQYVNGDVSPVEVHGRVLNPYCSYYKNIDVNDVRSKERSAVYNGTYRYEATTRIKSKTQTDPLCVDPDDPDSLCCYPAILIRRLYKPAGSPNYTFIYAELLPAKLNESKTIEYSGKGINYRDFSGNNLDYVGTNFLYNKELSAEISSNRSIERLNITVLANNDGIILAELKPTKYLNYDMKAHTTGIADLSYNTRDLVYDPTRGDYPTQTEGDERYWGTFDITRNIYAGAIDKGPNCNTTDPLLGKGLDSVCVCEIGCKTIGESWLPCCTGGWASMSYIDKASTDYSGIFGCSCNTSSK